LPDFVRFVFVLSVLEQYTEHDCAQLLGCSLKEIQSARIRALELIAIADLSASTRGTGSANLQEMTI
jgi:DNA-directed RNA polymerase specialized sigma24 family protein